MAVVDPRRPGKTLTTIRLRDRALATSANTMSFVRYGANRRGHVMDPATGYPADRVLQTTALASSGMHDTPQRSSRRSASASTPG